MIFFHLNSPFYHNDPIMILIIPIPCTNTTGWQQMDGEWVSPLYMRQGRCEVQEEVCHQIMSTRSCPETTGWR